MNILITGVHGFVGRNLAKFLGNEHKVYGMSRSLDSVEGVKEIFDWEQLNNNLPNMDVVIHLAGKAHDTKNQTEADEYFRINTELTKKVFDYVINHRVGKFFFFSSVKAVADTVQGSILTEEMEACPVGLYGESKRLAEFYIYSGFSRLTSGQRAYILRPCMIHGEGNKGNLNLLYHVVNKGIPWPLGGFHNKRSFLNIDNLMYLLDELLKKDAPSDAYQLADDEAISTNNLIKIICEALGRNPHILNIPAPVIRFLAKCGNVCRLPLNSERLSKLTENYVVSNNKIKQVLGIKSLPVSVQEGLIKTIQSFK